MTESKFSDYSPLMLALERLHAATQARDRCKNAWAKNYWNLIIKRLERQVKHG
jgi:hypothetical protein